MGNLCFIVSKKSAIVSLGFLCFLGNFFKLFKSKQLKYSDRGWLWKIIRIHFAFTSFSQFTKQLLGNFEPWKCPIYKQLTFLRYIMFLIFNKNFIHFTLKVIFPASFLFLSPIHVQGGGDFYLPSVYLISFVKEKIRFLQGGTTLMFHKFLKCLFSWRSTF